MDNTSGVTLLEDRFDIKFLQDECRRLIDSYAFVENQLCLTHRVGFEDKRWHDGCGSPLAFDDDRTPLMNEDGTYKLRYVDTDLNILNPELEGTVIGEIYETFRKRYKVGRYRLAGIKPKTCYGWHSDWENRIHIPVFTYPGCFIIVPDKQPIHLPADGSSYMFYAKDYHTAINADYSRIRYHLLINIW